MWYYDIVEKNKRESKAQKDKQRRYKREIRERGSSQ